MAWWFQLLAFVASSPFVPPLIRWAAVRMLGWRYVQMASRRDILDRLHSVEDQLKANDTAIYGCWLTGQTWLEADEQILARKAIKQVILPHPEKAAIAIANLHAHAPLELANQIDAIRRLTRVAQRHGLNVAWYPGFIGMGLTFVNPTESRGWAVVELILPTGEPAARPTFRITRRSDEGTVNQLWKAYQTMLTKCEPPPPLNQGSS